jgi:predicted GNAT superfamily acetyltransferase
MAIVVEPIVDLDGFSACAAVQRIVLGEEDPIPLPVAALVGVQRSGGLVLGAYDNTDPTPQLLGCLVDLVAAGKTAARLTLFHGVVPQRRNRGAGTALRRDERKRLRDARIAVVRWAIDPLDSVEAYVALSKLGALGVAYERDLFGHREDPVGAGLATDRMVIEWRLDAPRVAAIVDAGAPPAHLRLGLDRMDVITRTRLVSGGGRRFLGFRAQSEGELLLAEIPVAMDRLRADGGEVARDWRLGTRELFESLLARGYVVTGLLHTGGRSFHVLEQRSKEELLDRVE